MVIIRTTAVEVSIQAVLPVSSLAAAASCASAGPASSASAPSADPSTVIVLLRFMGFSWNSAALEGRRAGLAGADAGDREKVEHEDLAVADAARLGARADGRNDAVGLSVIDCDLDLELGKEVHRIFGAAVDFGMALLAAIAFDFGHGHAVDVERIQRLTHLLKPGRLDDCDHEFHGCPFRLTHWSPMLLSDSNGVPNRPRLASVMILISE